MGNFKTPEDALKHLTTSALADSPIDLIGKKIKMVRLSSEERFDDFVTIERITTKIEKENSSKIAGIEIILSGFANLGLGMSTFIKYDPIEEEWLMIDTFQLKGELQESKRPDKIMFYFFNQS